MSEFDSNLPPTTPGPSGRAASSAPTTATRGSPRSQPRTVRHLLQGVYSNKLGHGHGQKASRPCRTWRWSKTTPAASISRDIPGTEKVYEADLVLLALGFLGPGGGHRQGHEPGDRPAYELQGRFRPVRHQRPGRLRRRRICRRGQSLVVSGPSPKAAAPPARWTAS